MSHTLNEVLTIGVIGQSVNRGSFWDSKNEVDLQKFVKQSAYSLCRSFSDQQICLMKKISSKSHPSHDRRSDSGIGNDADVPKSKKKKQGKTSDKHLTICLSNCRYEVIKRVAAIFGMREVMEEAGWNVYWTDLSVSVERAKDLKRYQRINHFPGMTEICRKDLLARNLNRMQKFFPKEYNFFPKTWCLPTDYAEVMNYSKQKRAKTFIIKPDTGCQGRGIYLTKNLKDVKTEDRNICQVYVARPYLIDGYKFDLRIYVLLTSCDPLRIFIYNDGLARFATTKYKDPNWQNASNVFMHLTNYAINRHSRMYVTDNEFGSKRRISTLRQWMNLSENEFNDVWRKIDDIVIKTVITASPILKHSYRACFPNHASRPACFEILGFDILLDWKLKPYLLEVNHSPSFNIDGQVDRDVKESLLVDTFELLNLNQSDKRRVMEEDRKRVRERLVHGVRIGQEDREQLERRWKWENEHAGNFRLIYPREDSDKYEVFFKQSLASLYQYTIATKAHEDALRQRKMVNLIERRGSSGKHKRSNSEDFKRPIRMKSAPTGLGRTTESAIGFTRSSFEPEIISESEERTRLESLAQRDFLIKSRGLFEYVYMAMKLNGNVQSSDERKYGAVLKNFNSYMAFRRPFLSYSDRWTNTHTKFI